jgi:predicted CXXCH cytochrome family protein
MDLTLLYQFELAVYYPDRIFINKTDYLLNHETIGGFTMRQFVKAVLTTAVVGAALMFTGTASAAIADTPHNLGTSNNLGAGGGPNGNDPNVFGGTGEICIFCHTPHGGDTSAAVPLWNRTLALPATYTTYDALGTSTLDGEVANVGSVSIACLSCHDGTQAMDSVINEPGSGLINPTYRAGDWGTSGDVVGPNDGRMDPNIVQMLGTDLQNDHPIGIQFAGGGADAATVTPSPASMNDVDFQQISHEVVAGDNIWWVNATGGTNAREKTDVALYTRTDFSGGTDEPSVECGSCHDPHGTANPTFLRVTTTGSGICLTCHNK